MRQFMFLSVLVCLVAGSVSVSAQVTVRGGIVTASYQEAFGWEPTVDERRYWEGRTDWQTQQQLVNMHLSYQKGDAGTQNRMIQTCYAFNVMPTPTEAAYQYWRGQISNQPRVFVQLARDIGAWNSNRAAMIRGSYQQAFGRPSDNGEYNYWIGRLDFADQNALTELHRQYIRANSGVADDVIKRSYQLAFGRDPVPGEWNFWRQQMQQRTMLCGELVDAHNRWKSSTPALVNQNTTWGQKIQQGAWHINNALELLVKLTDGNYLKFPAGSYKVEGGRILSHNGAQLIGLDGASLIGNDAGSLISNNSSLIGMDGATLIGADGASFRR